MNTLTVTAIISEETGGQALGLPPSKPNLERSRKVFEKAELKNDLAKSGLQDYCLRVDSTTCSDYRRIHQFFERKSGTKKIVTCRKGKRKSPAERRGFSSFCINSKCLL